VIFIFITASFYSDLARRVNGIDVNSSSFRAVVSPLNPARDPRLAEAVQAASTASFHVAMMTGAVLLLAGALVNAIWISNRRAAQPEPSEAATPAAVS
jgi:hypothetical protein